MERDGGRVSICDKSATREISAFYAHEAFGGRNYLWLKRKMACRG